jgi:beta-glucosidase/6-phospho-beta-glucosidase/beta-galactosidase
MRSSPPPQREWKEGFSTKFGIVNVDFKNKALPRK